MASYIERRKFLATLGGAAVAWPLAACSLIGFLRHTSLVDATHLVAAFRQGLKEAGFIEGRSRDRIPFSGRSTPSIAGSSR
jgi:putative tryptophan/tyrosine transport system substrate-binding protein